MAVLGLLLRLASWFLYIYALIEIIRVVGGVSGSHWWLALSLFIAGAFVGFWSKFARGYDLQKQIDGLKSSH